MHGSFAARLLAAVAFSSAALSCTPPVKAPEGVDAFTRFLYREWANEDPAPLEDGLLKLEAFIETLELTPDQELSQRRFELEQTVDAVDLATVVIPPGTDPANTIPMALAAESRWPIEDHAKLQSSGDLLAAEPTAKVYTRTYPEMAAPACFDTRECAELNTFNVITRENPFLKVTFELPKKFKWVKLGADRWAIVGRSWTEKVWPGESEGTSIQQSYTLDVWLQRPDGKTWRYQGIYNESKVGIDDRSLTISTVTQGADDGFKASDVTIGKRYHGE